MGWKNIPQNKVKKLLSNDLSGEQFDELFKDKRLLVNSDKTAKIISTTLDVINVFEKIKVKGIQPLFIGLGVADTQDFKRARLNLSFATRVSELSVTKVFINTQAEKLFIYGRDVWSGSITRIEGKPERRKLVFVFNNEGVFLGIAFAIADKLLGKGRKTMLMNVIDIGHYLRAEK